LAWRTRIRRKIPIQILEGLEICLHKGMYIVQSQRQVLPDAEIRLPNCTDTSWTVGNIKTRDIRIALTNVSTVGNDLEYLRNKFGFSENDMTEVPQNPFTYLRKVFKDTTFRMAQYKMLYKLTYTLKRLKQCRIVDSDICERCDEEVEDTKHLLWECSSSRNIWKEVERYIRNNFNIAIELKYHNIIMGVNPAMYKNHELVEILSLLSHSIAQSFLCNWKIHVIVLQN
jgi:zinc-binding in reverse transcriptase